MAMLDKFLFFLSIEPFCATIAPVVDDRLVHAISQCAKDEIYRMLGSNSNYYMIDISAERVRQSKREFVNRLRADSALVQMAGYIAYLADLFDNPPEKRIAIDLAIREKVDRLLSMDFGMPSDAIFLAVQKIHQEEIYYFSDFDIAPWIDAVLSSYSGPWAVKLQDGDLFDGIDDMLKVWMDEVVSSFSLFGLFGIAKSICSQEELLALIENIEGIASGSTAIDAEIADRLLPGLRMVQ